MEGLESFFTVSEQLKLFLLSCLFGLPAGMCYDVFRTVRLMIPHKKWAVAAEDIVFFCLYAVFVMSFTVSAARSEFRFYFCLGNILGFTVYHFTVGNLIVHILKTFIMKVKKILNVIFSPIRKKIVPLCEKFRAVFCRTIQNIFNRKKNSEIDLIDNGDLLYNSKKDINKEQKKDSVKT